MKLEDAVKLVGLKFLIPVVFQRWLVIVINFNKERAFCVGFFFFFPVDDVEAMLQPSLDYFLDRPMLYKEYTKSFRRKDRYLTSCF